MPETPEIIAEVRHFDKGFRFFASCSCGPGLVTGKETKKKRTDLSASVRFLL